MEENTTPLPGRSPAPPDHVSRKRVYLRVGGRRFELTHTIETREVMRGPAKVVEIPHEKASEGRE